MRSPWQWWRDREAARLAVRVAAFVTPLAASWREFEETFAARWSDVATAAAEQAVTAAGAALAAEVRPLIDAHTVRIVAQTDPVITALKGLTRLA